MQSTLAICIPTYNRAVELADLLDHIVEIAWKYNICIYISDNASEDNTMEIVHGYVDQYSNVFYHRHATNLGFLANFDYVLHWPTTEYCWLFGDDDLLVLEEIPSIIKMLSEGYDLLIVNGGEKKGNQSLCRVKNIPTQIYTDRNKLLADLGYHMSWMSVLIFHKTLLSDIELKKYSWSPFPHTVAIFDILSYHEHCKIYYMQNLCVYINSKDSTLGYEEVALRYFTKDWALIVEFLKRYSAEAKVSFLYGHRDNIHRYKLREFLGMRVKGIYNIKVFRELKKYLCYATKANIILLYWISIMPPLMPKRIYYFLRTLKKKIGR